MKEIRISHDCDASDCYHIVKDLLDDLGIKYEECEDDGVMLLKYYKGKRDE